MQLLSNNSQKKKMSTYQEQMKAEFVKRGILSSPVLKKKELSKDAFTPNNSPAIIGQAQPPPHEKFPFSFFDSDEEDDMHTFELPRGAISKKEEEIPKKKELTPHYDLACKNQECKFGERCLFAHTIDDFKPTPCKFDKRCTKGDKCTFKHSCETKLAYAKRRGMEFHNRK